MGYQRIDPDNWARKEFFTHYTATQPATYSMTVKLDITRLKQRGYKLYPVMLYLLTTVVNRHPEFRFALDKDGNPGYFDEMVPCYTVFHPETETFSNIWTDCTESLEAFCAAYRRDIEAFGSVKTMLAKPGLPDNNFPVSMIPWETFDGFNLNLGAAYDYFFPIFTMGKYDEENGRYLLPLAVQVHHAVCDGFHLSRFIKELRQLLAAL